MPPRGSDRSDAGWRAEARTLNGILRTTQASTRISQPPVSTSQPLLKEMIRPIASTVPATAKGVMAMTSSRSEIRERKRVMAKPMGTPISAASDGGGGGQHERVDQRPPGLTEQVAEIVEAEARLHHRAAELHEGDHDDGEERHERDQHHAPRIDRGQPSQPGLHHQLGRRAARRGREAAAAEIVALDEERDGGADDQAARRARRPRRDCRRSRRRTACRPRPRGSACPRPARTARRNSRSPR